MSPIISATEFLKSLGESNSSVHHPSEVFLPRTSLNGQYKAPGQSKSHHVTKSPPTHRPAFTSFSRHQYGFNSSSSLQHLSTTFLRQRYKNDDQWSDQQSSDSEQQYRKQHLRKQAPREQFISTTQPKEQLKSNTNSQLADGYSNPADQPNNLFNSKSPSNSTVSDHFVAKPLPKTPDMPLQTLAANYCQSVHHPPISYHRPDSMSSQKQHFQREQLCETPSTKHDAASQQSHFDSKKLFNGRTEAARMKFRSKSLSIKRSDENYVPRSQSIAHVGAAAANITTPKTSQLRKEQVRGKRLKHVSFDSSAANVQYCYPPAPTPESHNTTTIGRKRITQRESPPDSSNRCRVKGLEIGISSIRAPQHSFSPQRQQQQQSQFQPNVLKTRRDEMTQKFQARSLEQRATSSSSHGKQKSSADDQRQIASSSKAKHAYASVYSDDEC